MEDDVDLDSDWAILKGEPDRLYLVATGDWDKPSAIWLVECTGSNRESWNIKNPKLVWVESSVVLNTPKNAEYIRDYSIAKCCAKSTTTFSLTEAHTMIRRSRIGHLNRIKEEIKTVEVEQKRAALFLEWARTRAREIVDELEGAPKVDKAEAPRDHLNYIFENV
jgi:hypothetical protein